jgi:hypothetical protein
MPAEMSHGIYRVDGWYWILDSAGDYRTNRKRIGTWEAIVPTS